MPRVKNDPTPSEYAVLGLVLQRPTYGYELQRSLGGGSGLARVCPVEPAMTYAILKSLSGLDLIDGEWDSSSYPPRAVYRATDAGETAFQKWLHAPVARLREVRIDFLIKLYFLLEAESPAALALIEGQVEVCRELEASLEAAAESTQPGGFDAIALSAELADCRATTAWLAGCHTAIEKGHNPL